MSRNWVKDHYGEHLTKSEVRQVLSCNQQKVSSLVRWGHLRTIIDDETGEMLFSADNVLDILEKRPTNTSTSSDTKDDIEVTPMGSAIVDIDVIISQLRPMVQEMVKEEVARETIVVTKRERSSTPPPPPDQPTSPLGGFSPTEGIPSGEWRRNDGTAAFPVYI